MTCISDNSATFVLDVTQYASDFIKDNWVWWKCPWDWWTNGWNDIAWNSCALVNEDEYAYCGEQVGYHAGEFATELFIGENPDA